MEIPEFSLSWGALWKVLAMAAVITILFVARDVLIAVFLAIVISSAMDPLVDSLENRRIPRILGTITIYILVLFVVALIAYILVPVGLVELNGFLGDAGALSDAGDELSAQTGVNIQGTLNNLSREFIGGEITLVKILSRFLGGIITAIIVFVLSFYMTIDRHGVKKFLITVVPHSFQESVLEVYRRVHRKISSWFMAQLLLSVIVGFAVFIGLWILGVPYSLILGVAAAVLELIPLVGPIVSGILAILISMTISVPIALYVLILFVLIQQLEAHVLVPSVMGKSTNLSPVVVIVALLIGGSVFGIPGAILAVPVAVTFQEILYYWSEKQLPTLNQEA